MWPLLLWLLLKLLEPPTAPTPVALTSPAATAKAPAMAGGRGAVASGPTGFGEKGRGAVASGPTGFGEKGRGAVASGPTGFGEKCYSAVAGGRGAVAGGPTGFGEKCYQLLHRLLTEEASPAATMASNER
jgi:hypothetical protein